MVLVATQVKRRRGTTAENDAFTGAEGEITVDTEKHELRVHDGVTQGGFKIGGGSGSGRNIGDTFMTKRTDTNLAGAVECNGATYNTTDFTGSGSIGELLEAGKLDYISLSAYSTAIAQTGWCDKIGWDGTGTTSFRVPTLTPHIVQKNNIPVVGNGMTLGLTEGTYQYGLGSRNNDHHLLPVSDLYNTATGAISSSTSGANINAINSQGIGITTDPTKSGIIADTTDTAQLRVMIQIANGATDEALETCTGVLADVAGLKDHRVIAFQAPTAQNNYTWYRKYADGWVEQGGLTTDNEHTTHNLAIPMADTNYVLVVMNKVVGNYYSRILSMTTTGFIADPSVGSTTKSGMWQVSGMAAE